MIKSETVGRALVVTLSRPPVNAINEAWIERFEAILDALAVPDDIAVLHIRSDQRVFSAGADLELMRASFARPGGPDAMVAIVRRLQALYQRIERLPQVTLAEIGGTAAGGGFELALACDLRIAALETKLGLPEARLGLLPGAGGTQRLARLCGQAVARRVILAAELIDGAEAEALGLVHWAVPGQELAGYAARRVAAIAALPPAALAACKGCLAAAAEPGSGGFLAQLSETRRLFDNPETRALVASFLDRDAAASISSRKRALP